VHASLISGGQELSSYPEQCRLSLERRLIPGEDAGVLDQELRGIVSELSARDRDFRARIAVGYSARPLETPQETLIVRVLARCAGKVMGRDATLGMQSGWADAALLGEEGIPSVLFGPGGAGLHSAVEYVRLEEVRLCAEALAECARAFCNL
jgi:acetylornithine deacetylase